MGYQTRSGYGLAVGVVPNLSSDETKKLSVQLTCSQVTVGNGPPIDIGLTSHVPMRDNALPIGHNPVLFDVLRDYGMVSDIFDGDGLADQSRIGMLVRDWQRSYFIVQMFFTIWLRMDIELADWTWIANGLVNWLGIAGWSGV